MQTRSLILSLICGALLASALGSPAIQSEEQQAQIEVFRVPELDAGFHLLYELKLAEARAQFQARQKAHPDDPLGSAAEAASYLFSSRNSLKTRSLPASWPNSVFQARVGLFRIDLPGETIILPGGTPVGPGLSTGLSGADGSSATVLQQDT